MSHPGRLRDPARVFFALWPDPAVARALLARARDWHHRLGGRLTRLDTVHLTLVFVGDVEAGLIPRLIDTARSVSASSFDLELDRMGLWRHNRIVHAAPGRVPPALESLVAGLEQALTEAGVGFDRRPYRPHVTLVRKAGLPDGTPAMAPEACRPSLHWPVAAYRLVRSHLSQAGARYETLAEFPLR